MITFTVYGVFNIPFSTKSLSFWLGFIYNKNVEERGYNSENQIAGYLISNDPAYISSHKNARNLIQKIERYEIIEELVRAYLDK